MNEGDAAHAQAIGVARRVRANYPYIVAHLLGWTHLGPPMPWGAAKGQALDDAKDLGLMSGLGEPTTLGLAVADILHKGVPPMPNVLVLEPTVVKTTVRKRLEIDRATLVAMIGPEAQNARVSIDAGRNVLVLDLDSDAILVEWDEVTQEGS